MFLEGQIIEFLDSDELRVGYVRKQERDRLQIVDPRGRNMSIAEDRVVIVHQRCSEGEFASRAREISERIAARRSEFDIELLWQSLGGIQREMTLPELAEVFFTDVSPEAISAVFRALSEDTLFFKRKGSQFTARSAEQVDTERAKRDRQRQREAAREQLVDSLTRVIRNRKLEIPDDLAPALDRIHNWIRHKTGDEVGVILEEIAGPNRARDAGYDILLRAGRVPAESDRFLVTAGLDPHFPAPVTDAAARLAAYVHSDERLDYRAVPAFTIDDEDTREVDDALTIRHEDSEIIVGIHIADVSAFVEKGDVLDTEGARRSSTIYLPSTTVCMFPERLSTDLASLQQGADRPAVTVEVRFDEHGNRLGYRIALSTIHVARRLSYDEADQLLDPASGLEWQGLRTLHQISTTLLQARAARGAITFRRPELKIRVHADGIHVKKINPSSPSRLLVSEMMILANGLTADFASVNSIPVIFRTQEPREALAIDQTPATEALAFERLRKTFKRSRLSLTPGLHSGLGLTAYTQASSPIRRYADLVTQRQFTALLGNKTIPYTREELLQILVSAETAEQEVRGIEDRSTNYWLLQYLEREKMNQPMNAVVLDSKNTIELDDYYLRGKISGPLGEPPGTIIPVMIESVDPLKGDVRFKRA